MKTRYAKFILILLSCLLISTQTYAEPALVHPKENVQDPNSGMSMDNPIEVVIEDCCFSYTNEANYNVGFTGKLRLYYRMQIKEPTIIAVQTRTNVSLQTFILDEHGNTVVLDNGGNINATRLEPAIYYVYQTVHDKDIYLHTTITGTSAIVGNCLHLPVQIEQSADDGSISFQKLCNTTEYTDHYQGRSTNDVFFSVDIKKNISCTVTVEPAELKDGVELTFMNGNQKTLYTILKRRDMKFDLLPGLYYFVAEGIKQNGRFIFAIEGEAIESEQREYYTPSGNMNYIRTIVPTRSVNTIDSLYYLSKTKHSIRYFDHLGRPVQEVAYKSSPDKKDVAVFHEYDALGRSSKQWLPVMRTSQSPGTFIPENTVEKNAKDLYADQAAFSYPVYETSSLNRIIENYGPGMAWQSKGYSEKTNYRTNTSADACLYLSVSGTPAAPQLLQKGKYPVSELTVVETKDEDGHTIFSFKDREGHVILNRNLTAQETLDTYYVYDDFGNLCFVLSPMAVANLSSSSQTILDKYAYQYRYDYRRRCIGKKLPGCGWVEMVYDCNSRLVFTRDSEQQKRGECRFSFSDLLGREVLSGVYQGALPDYSSCDVSDIYAVFSPGIVGTREGYRINCPVAISLEKLKVLQANYYDTYTFASILSGFGGSLSYAEDTDIGKRYSGDPDLHCKDLLTGSMTLTLGGNQRLYSTYYYDYDRNLIQKRCTALNGKTIVNKSAFNFSGQSVKTIEEYGAEVSVQKSYVYDHMGRMIREIHVLGKDSTEFIYNYDLQDRVIRQTRIHGQDSLAIDNQYNIRSWIQSIQSPQFSQELYYTDGNGTPCYNGNISSMTWKCSDGVTHGYKYTYDGQNRLQNAAYGQGTAINTYPERFTEQVTAYDKNGNILGLKRHGQTGASSYGLIDNLALTLNGNQLKAVNDAVTASAYNNGFEFKDGAKVATEYTYDTNGNLTKDLNKNITSIQYNMLNLPSVVSFSDASTITYTYGADGTKLRTVHKIGSTTTTTDYLGNVIYENGVAKLLLTGYGYISLNDKKYHYYLQDYQGNNRVVVDSSGKVNETNHYYPFGGVFASTGNVQPYKYNGKELDAKKGLNWYDYGARMYDPTLGRWHTVDPLAEKFYGITPYNYCFDNPIRYIDPDGSQGRPARTMRRGPINGGRPNPYAFYPGGARPQSYRETTNFSYRGTGLRRQVPLEEQRYLQVTNTPGGNEVQMSSGNKWGQGLSGTLDLAKNYLDFKDMLVSLATTVKYGENGIIQKSLEMIINDPELALQQLDYEAQARSIDEELGELDFTGKSLEEILEMSAERKDIIQERLGLSPRDILWNEFFTNPEAFQTAGTNRRILPEFRQH